MYILMNQHFLLVISKVFERRILFSLLLFSGFNAAYVAVEPKN